MEIRRLSACENLFIHSEDIQKLLTSSYLNIIRFWAKVEQHYKSWGVTRAAKSLISHSIKSLDSIISDMVEDGKNIDKWIPIVKETLRRSDHDAGMKEAQKAMTALEELVKKAREARKGAYP